MRASATGNLSKYKFLLAEEVNVFAPQGSYQNLLRFEADIAQISELILLFSESAGSFAELGAFSMVDEITERLLVLIDDKFYEDNSFIRRGPVQYLENRYGNSAVYVIVRADVGMGNDGRPADIDSDRFREKLSEAIKRRMSTSKQHSTFDKSRDGHLIKLITGLLQDYAALTMEEISLIIGYLGIELPAARLSEYMICAKAFNWVVEIRSGFDVFWVALAQKEAIQFLMRAGSPHIDRLRWRADVLSYWKDNDPLRYQVIQSVRRAS